MQTIRYIKHNEIDFKKWDKTVLSSKIPYVFAQSFYLNATSPNWNALVYEDYESVFPITNKSKFGISYLPQPPFTSQLGGYGNLTEAIEKQFYNYISNNYKLIEIELNSFNNLKSPFTFNKKTHIIEYALGYSYNQNTKRNILKASTNHLKVIEVEQNDILPLSKKYINSFLLSELKLPKASVTLFDNLIESSIKNESLVSFKVIDLKNQIRALAHFIFNSNYVVFLKGTNFDKLENSGSMHLLISHAITYFSDKCQWFDFGGGSLNEGLAGFYKGLGGMEQNYSYLKINNLPKFIKLLKK
ncbi:MAG: hypothetical protein SFY56_09760 [Bacteroidota bacterium]|nr:hypothetical protein [Bacteroidota bacterium]